MGLNREGRPGRIPGITGRNRFFSKPRAKAVTRILLDDTLKAKLHNLTQPLELCDETGRVMARVFPTPDRFQYEPWEPSFSEEELQHQEEADEKR
jgi:hypothetical protein